MVKSPRVKTNKTNIERSKQGNLRSWEERLAEQLKDWSLKPDSFMIEEFITNMDIPETTFHQALDRNPILNEAHNFALLRIGINREKLAAEKSLGMNSAVMWTMAQYHKRHKKEQEFRAKLKAETEAASIPEKLIDHILLRNVPNHIEVTE